MTLSEPILLEFCLLPNRISRFAPQWTCLCAKELDVNQQLACSFQSNPPSKSFNLNIHCKTLHYTSLEAVWQLLDITSAATCIGAYWSYSKLQIESSFIWQSEKGLYQSLKKKKIGIVKSVKHAACIGEMTLSIIIVTREQAWLSFKVEPHKRSSYVNVFLVWK